MKNGGDRTRLSTFAAGVFLMVLCIAFGPWVPKIPMAALVAVMVLVSFGTFDWHSVAPATLRRMPYGETIAALDAVENKYAARGKKVTVVGLNKPSAELHKTLAGQLTGGH